MDAIIAPSLTDTASRWVRPPVGVFKLNCDALVKRNGFIEVGFVIRDHNGLVSAAGVDRFMGNMGVLCAETLAIHCGLSFVMRITFDVC